MHQETRPLAAEVESVVKQSGSSFYWAMRLLGKQKRDAMFAIYAFCREIDDIADEPALLEQKQRALQVWRDDLDKIYAGGQPTQRIAEALIAPIKMFNLPKDEFVALIDGMEMDIPDGMRAPTMTELQLYCRRVAGAVGMLSVCVFGDFSETAQRFAITLGEALQLTNILRDMDEDMELGRLYMPRECLDKAGIAVTDDTHLSEILNHPNLGVARAALAEQALLRYAESDAALAKLNAKQMKPAVIMQAAYRKIFDAMQKRGWNVVRPRIKTPKSTLLLTALRIWLTGR